MNSQPEGTSRLDQAHSQAIKEVEHHIKHWKNVQDDYGQLSERLKSLPLKLSHEVMVPFGPLAFIPGKLVHTNELLVHLGDSWFSEMTCNEGQKIIGHRLETVDKNLSDLNKTLKNLQEKTGFSKRVLSNKEDDEDTFEIKEAVPNDYAHPSVRKRISRVKGESTKKSHPKPTSASTLPQQQNADKDLMERLNALEKLEEDSDDDYDSVDNKTTDLKFKSASGLETKHSEPASVRFKHTPSVSQAQTSELTPAHIGKEKLQPDALSDTVQEHNPVTSYPRQKANKKVSRFKAERKK